MTRNTSTLIERISQSEAKIKQLIDQRNNELLNIIVKHNALTINDSLLSGFFLFAMNPDNKDSPILKQFGELAATSKIPSRPKNNNSKSVKTTN
jgi:hypothetical protein